MPTTRWDFSTTGFPVLDATDRDDPALNIRLGAYYPTGYALFMLASPEEARSIADVLPAGSSAGDDKMQARLLPPDVTAAFMLQALEEGGLLAGIVASETKQTKMLMELANAGHAMLAVRIRDDEQKNAILTALADYRFPKALFYHTLAIEELPVSIDDAPGSDVYGMNERPRDDLPPR